MLKTIALAFAVMTTAALGNAQVPSGNIFAGYSYSGGDVFAGPQPGAPSGAFLQPPSRSANFNGWEGSLEGKLLPWIGIVADLSGHYASRDFNVVCNTGGPQCSTAPETVNGNIYTFLFGPRVSVSVGKFTPFAHGLFGAGHVNGRGGATSFATAIGGGLDYKLVKGLAWRVQGDEVHTKFFDSTQDHFRFSTGIVARF